MHLRFGHVLLLMTSLSAAATAVAFTSVLHAALLQSGFSASLLRQPVNTEALLDFLSQVPPQKLLFLFLTHSSAHVLLMLMLAANGLLLIGWIVQRALFADSVSQSEIKVARENTLHFAVFRLLFLGSILESTSSSGSSNAAGLGAESVPLAPGAGPLRELACWLMWFGVMGFLRWFLVLLRERFQTAQSSPYATVHTFTKYLLLTVAFSVANLAMALAVLFVLRPHTTWAVVSLLLFENVILLASCLKIIFRYALYIRTLQKEQPWEERGSTLYYSDMLCEMSVQVTTLAHLVHIWTCYGLSFSLIDLFLFLHVRQLLVGVWRNLVAMRNYSRALWELNARFPDASPDELQRQQDDVCSICRDSMEQAKKLPCGHLFHRTCLQQWIEHASFCPTCRAPLLPRGPAAQVAAAGVVAPAQMQAQRLAQQQPGAALMQGMEAQNVVAQLHRLQQAHAAGLAVGMGGGGGGGGGGNGYPGSASSSIHSVGLRHRSTAAPSSAAMAASPSSILGIQSPPPSAVQSTHGHGGTSSPTFDMRHMSSWHSSQMSNNTDSEASYRAALAEAEAASAAEANSASSAASSEEAKETAAASSASTLSVRERVYEATQRRLLGEQQAARGAISPASPTAASSSSTASDADPSSSVGPSSPAVATSASDVAASAAAAPSTPAFASSSSSSLPPAISSPPLLSQAEADANLARQLQEEEVLAAAEEQQRRNGASAFGRFFAAL